MTAYFPCALTWSEAEEVNDFIADLVARRKLGSECTSGLFLHELPIAQSEAREWKPSAQLFSFTECDPLTDESEADFTPPVPLASIPPFPYPCPVSNGPHIVASNLASRVKNFQRSSRRQCRQWYRFVNAHSRSSRDPSRHPAWFLEKILKSVPYTCALDADVPSTEIVDSSDEKSDDYLSHLVWSTPSTGNSPAACATNASCQHQNDMDAVSKDPSSRHQTDSNVVSNAPDERFPTVVNRTEKQIDDGVNCAGVDLDKLDEKIEAVGFNEKDDVFERMVWTRPSIGKPKLMKKEHSESESANDLNDSTLNPPNAFPVNSYTDNTGSCDASDCKHSKNSNTIDLSFQLDHACGTVDSRSHVSFNVMDSLDTIESKTAALGFELCDDTSIFTVASRLAQSSTHNIAIQSLVDEGYLLPKPSVLNMVCTKSDDLKHSAIDPPLAVPANSFTCNYDAGDNKHLNVTSCSQFSPSSKRGLHSDAKTQVPLSGNLCTSAAELAAHSALSPKL